MVKAILQERRRYPRAKRVLSIEFRLVKRKGRPVDGNWFLSTTEDMSLGGIAFYTDQEYQIGDILEVRVTMSGIIDILKGQARVVRTERKATGAYHLAAVQLFKPRTRPLRRPIPRRFSRKRLVSNKSRKRI